MDISTLLTNGVRVRAGQNAGIRLGRRYSGTNYSLSVTAGQTAVQVHIVGDYFENSIQHAYGAATLANHFASTHSLSERVTHTSA